MSGLTALVEVLSTRIDDTGAWVLTSDELREILGVASAPFWRAVHEQRMRIAFSDAVDGFSQDTVGDFVTVVEALVGPEAEGAFTRAGLFIPHELGVELTENLLTNAGRSSAAHALRAAEFAAMLRYAGSVQGAIGIYLGEHVDREALIESCAESFRVRHGMPEPARATAVRYLLLQLTRHIIERRSLTAVLEGRLKAAAAELGFVDPEERPRAGARGRADGRLFRGSRGRAWAAGVMGIGEGPVDAGDLRTRYRRLMMSHHPDVDPAGLELCKDVNAAYALLTAEVTRGG